MYYRIVHGTAYRGINFRICIYNLKRRPSGSVPAILRWIFLKYTKYSSGNSPCLAGKPSLTRYFRLWIQVLRKDWLNQQERFARDFAHSHHSWKAVKRATSKEGTTGRILRKKRFSQAQNFSMGLSSGEYGGRNRSLQPAFWAAENNRFLEWNEALSITITVPLSREGRSWLENQNSKRLLSIVPLYWNGERILSAILAATMPQRLYFRPLIRPNTCCPRGAYPYSRYKYVSMPHSST